MNLGGLWKVNRSLGATKVVASDALKKPSCCSSFYYKLIYTGRLSQRLPMASSQKFTIGGSQFGECLKTIFPMLFLQMLHFHEP